MIEYTNDNLYSGNEDLKERFLHRIVNRPLLLFEQEPEELSNIYMDITLYDGKNIQSHSLFKPEIISQENLDISRIRYTMEDHIYRRIPKDIYNFSYNHRQSILRDIIPDIETYIRNKVTMINKLMDSPKIPKLEFISFESTVLYLIPEQTNAVDRNSTLANIDKYLEIKVAEFMDQMRLNERIVIDYDRI